MRHKPSCKKCGGLEVVKNGHNKCGTQRYKCKYCNSVFVWKYNKKEKLPKHREKKKILACYEEGMGIRALCRVFKVSSDTISKWLKSEGKNFKQPDIKNEKFVSCDEMWTFVANKKQKAWIWLGYSNMSKKILAVHIGNRDKYSAEKLISQIPNMKIYCTDDWHAYDGVIDKDKREIGKRNTQDIGCKSIFSFFRQSV